MRDFSFNDKQAETIVAFDSGSICLDDLLNIDNYRGNRMVRTSMLC